MFSTIIIGSGFSGICLGIKLKERGIHDFVILEKAKNIGGTWRENTYPGAECDIPSALYSYSFEQYPDWEFKWSHQPQILEYLTFCAKKYLVYPHIEFQSEVTGAHWNEDQSIWSVELKDGKVFTGQILVTAIGQLHHPYIPSIPGKNLFQGISFHSSNWQHDIKLENKNIGVIGNAASAIQFIPQIARVANTVTVIQRSANWVLPKQDRLYKEWEKKLVKRFPLLLKIYRLKLWLLGGAFYFLMKDGSHIIRKIYEHKSKSYIKRHIKDPNVVEVLTPKYPLGAKRVLFSDDYYESLNRENVQLVNSTIKELTKEGIRTSRGSLVNFDVIIYATGFKTHPFLAGINITGRNQNSLSHKWIKGSINYLGMSISGFPNMFMMYGPNTNLGHNSIIIMSEAQANYIAQCIDALKTNHWKSLDIKESVLQAYYDDIQVRLKKMIWGHIEKSWYKSANGTIENNWPGRTMEYMRRTKNVNFKDFEITPSR